MTDTQNQSNLEHIPFSQISTKLEQYVSELSQGVDVDRAMHILNEVTPLIGKGDDILAQATVKLAEFDAQNNPIQTIQASIRHMLNSQHMMSKLPEEVQQAMTTIANFGQEQRQSSPIGQ